MPICNFNSPGCDNLNTTAWLSTTGSQIFFMQLGFLCYEVGYVKSVWTQTVILKNIEDTFVGILTFLALGYTLSESKHSLWGVIAIPTNPFIIGVDTSSHDQILILAFFASTCATIISGAVLERMKNKAYIVWCMLTILVNYSFVSHWIWHKDGWLNKLGFVDGAGSIVVHSTAGMAALIAIWRLGPRTESIPDGQNIKKNNIQLLPISSASNPVIHTMGAFFLWFGWFAFNVSSPIAFSKGIGDAIGTTALVTVISPISATCAAFLWMNLGWIELSFEHLLSCILAGLVSVTGMCHTIDIWESFVLGFLASGVYLLATRIIRNKWHLDDPMQVIAIHLFCGVYSGIGEGLGGNNVYGTPGLFHGGGRHFVIQVGGVVIVIGFNFIVSLLLWEIVLKRIIFRKEDMRVNILDTYLGTRLFDQNYDMALNEVLNCNSTNSKQMLYEFHEYIEHRYASEQFDFLIVCKVFKHFMVNKTEDTTPKNIAKYMLQIIDTYVAEHGDKCINISGTQRSILIKIQHQLISELKSKNENKLEINYNYRDDIDEKEEYYLYKSTLDITKESVFDAVYLDVWKIIIPHFMQFLRHSFDKKNNFGIKKLRIPFTLTPNWIVEWDEELTKDTENIQLNDIIPQFNTSQILLMEYNIDSDDNYPIIFVDEQNKNEAKKISKSVALIE